MSKRVSIEIAGLAHKNPIPAACRIGPLLTTSVITGQDPSTGQHPEGIEAQCAQMFANIRQILAAGGAEPADVAKMNVWLKDLTLRPHLNKEWLAMFPDAHSRPARHTFQASDMPHGMLVQCDVIAFVEDR